MLPSQCFVRTVHSVAVSQSWNSRRCSGRKIPSTNLSDAPCSTNGTVRSGTCSTISCFTASLNICAAMPGARMCSLSMNELNTKQRYKWNRQQKPRYAIPAEGYYHLPSSASLQVAHRSALAKNAPSRNIATHDTPTL